MMKIKEIIQKAALIKNHAQTDRTAIIHTELCHKRILEEKRKQYSSPVIEQIKKTQ